MTYINQGPIMLNVDMHKPTSSSRNIMDSLLAFWPGLQVCLSEQVVAGVWYVSVSR